MNIKGSESHVYQLQFQAVVSFARYNLTIQLLRFDQFFEMMSFGIWSFSLIFLKTEKLIVLYSVWNANKITM